MMVTALAQTRKRINIELPCAVIDRLDKLAHQDDSSRAELIRKLLQESLVRKEKEEMELTMKEGYTANYRFIKESNSEWDFALKISLALS